MRTGLRMHLRPGSPRAASLLFVAALACTAAADAPRIQSVWTADALTIDGMLKEWASLVSLDPVKVSVGVRNDARSIYVAITASDQPTRTLLGSAGFSVWLDPAGKHKKAFGITIPPTIAGVPGMRGRGLGGTQSSTPPEQGQEGERAAQADGPGGPGRGALEPIRHIELTAGPGKDDRRRLELTYARTIGIDVAARLAEGVLVYEIRLPLSESADRPYFLHSAPGAVIGFGMETTKVEREREDEGRRGGGPGGGGPGGGGGIGGIGGGMGGRGGGRMGGGMMGGGPGGGGRGGMEGQKPINTWTVVQLAQSPE
jgi:hypothetical protein